MSRFLSPAYKAKRSRHRRLVRQRGSLTLEYGIVISGVSIAFILAMIGTVESIEPITAMIQQLTGF